MKTGFLFFCCRPSASWQAVYKSQERKEPSVMSKSDTMFNVRDRRYAAVQLMLSTDPSYDNRTIASTLNMQIRTVQRLRAMHWTTLWRWWCGRTPPGRPGPRSSSKRSRQSWMKLPAAYSVNCQRFRRLTHNCECMCEGGLEV